MGVCRAVTRPHVGEHHLLFRWRSAAGKTPTESQTKSETSSQMLYEVPELKQFSYESVGLLKRFLDIREKRNDLMHAAIANISAKDSAFKFLKVAVSPNNQHSARLVYLRDEEWTEFRRKLIRRGKEGQALAQRVEKRLRIHHP